VSIPCSIDPVGARLAVERVDRQTRRGVLRVRGLLVEHAVRAVFGREQRDEVHVR